jgi:transcriptional regulator with XRE-family HTH domain
VSVREPETVTVLRRQFGAQLAARRAQAGLSQEQYARQIGFSRSTVAGVESGRHPVSAQFCSESDRALRTGDLFARGRERILARLAAERRTAAERAWQSAVSSGPEMAGSRLLAPDSAGALAAYRDLGWPVEDTRSGLWLVTGTRVDALEVSRPAGLLAVAWWRASLGAPDPVRGLPALPDPAEALAAIAAKSRCYFLANAGEFPWTPPDTDAAAETGGGAIRWHSHDSPIPLPPSHNGSRHAAVWVYAPPGPVRLASPAVLLHLLATAAAAARQADMLLLPSGVTAVPAVATKR